jgi:quercetin dioxygenase-like cupin family protein
LNDLLYFRNKKNMNLATLTSKEIMPGYHGKMVHGQKLTWVFWTVDQGAEVKEHHHPHEQIMHVVSGEFEFTLKGETKIYRAGDIVCIPSNISHSGKALTDCELMDIFSPARDEYQ